MSTAATASAIASSPVAAARGRRGRARASTRSTRATPASARRSARATGSRPTRSRRAARAGAGRTAARARTPGRASPSSRPRSGTSRPRSPGGRAGPPRRREEVRVERADRRGVLADLGPAGVCDRAREQRPLQLVGEDPGRRDARRLPGVERQQDEVRHQQRVGRQQAVEQCGLRLRQRSTPRMTRGSTSTSRRTKRQSISRDAQARTISSRRSFGAFGIVTKTMSGRVRSRTLESSSSPRRREHRSAAGLAAVDRRRRTRRLVRPVSRAARAACCVPCGPRRRSGRAVLRRCAPVRCRG